MGTSTSPRPKRQTRNSRPSSSSGVTKTASKSTRSKSANIRPRGRQQLPENYFYYTTPDNTTHRATCIKPNKDKIIPQQSDNYILNPAVFANIPYPSTFPPNIPWPPTTPSEILQSMGNQCAICIHDTPFSTADCFDQNCTHDINTLIASSKDWSSSFALRDTTTRGIGVYTLRPFPAETVLGLYTGEIKPYASTSENDYLMDIDIGVIPPIDWANYTTLPGTSDMLYPIPGYVPPNAGESVVIDAEEKGNWTRFVNHSCEPSAVFRIRRVGGMRVMSMETVRDVPAGVELTVSYGDMYYGKESSRVCACAVENCVGNERRRLAERGIIQTYIKSRKIKQRVKKCKRKRPEDA